MDASGMGMKRVDGVGHRRQTDGSGLKSSVRTRLGIAARLAHCEMQGTTC
jgi:hypothetical protein